MDDSRSAEANRLYWESDVSVAEIADRLELSRRGLYDAVSPLPSDERCSDCGGTMAWPNRSARAAGTAICLSCGMTREVHVPDPDAEMGREGYVARDDERAADPLRDAGRHRRATLLGGVAIGAVAIGAVAAVIALRRD